MEFKAINQLRLAAFVLSIFLHTLSRRRAVAFLEVDRVLLF